MRLTFFRITRSTARLLYDCISINNSKGYQGEHSPIMVGINPFSTVSLFGCLSAKMTNARIVVPMHSAKKAVMVVTGGLTV